MLADPTSLANLEFYLRRLNELGLVILTEEAERLLQCSCPSSTEPEHEWRWDLVSTAP